MWNLDGIRLLSSFRLASFQFSSKIPSRSSKFLRFSFFFISRWEHLWHLSKSHERRSKFTSSRQLPKVPSRWRKRSHVNLLPTTVFLCELKPASEFLLILEKNLFDERFEKLFGSSHRTWVVAHDFWWSYLPFKRVGSYSRKAPLHWLLMPTGRKAETDCYFCAAALLKRLMANFSWKPSRPEAEFLIWIAKLK